jgi:hypothetical protein
MNPFNIVLIFDVECSVIRGFEKYAASKNGKIFNIKFKRELLSEINKEYGSVELFLENSKSIRVLRSHCIVLAWIGEKPSVKHTIDHIDRNPLNNCIENLRWATSQEQNKNRKQIVVKNVRKIIVINNNTGEIKYYRCAEDASKEVKIDSGTISKFLKNLRENTSDYTFCYENTNNDDFKDLEGEEWRQIKDYYNNDIFNMHLISNKGFNC